MRGLKRPIVDQGPASEERARGDGWGFGKEMVEVEADVDMDTERVYIEAQYLCKDRGKYRPFDFCQQQVLFECPEQIWNNTLTR